MVTRGAGLASKRKSNQTENQVLLQNDLMLTYKLWPTLHCIPNISRNLSANSGLPELDTCSKIQNLLCRRNSNVYQNYPVCSVGCNVESVSKGIWMEMIGDNKKLYAMKWKKPQKEHRLSNLVLKQSLFYKTETWGEKITFKMCWRVEISEYESHHWLGVVSIAQLN